jgi:hypothetical protein
MNHLGGLFQIGIRGRTLWRGGRLWGDLMIFFNLDSPQPGIYVRTDRVPIAASVPYASGARAGAPACATGEAELVDLPAGDTDARLAGRWTLCQGDLLETEAALDFDGQGGVRLLDASGAEIRVARYRVVNPETIPSTYLSTNLLFDDDTDWAIGLSLRPLKLWMLTPYTSRLARSAIFSAVP